MSDTIKHECGIAFIRLLKPLSFYNEKYGTVFYGVNKLYLLMEKQRNRGQDGAGAAGIKLDVQPGNRYISRYRSNSDNPIKEIYAKIKKSIDAVYREKPKNNEEIDFLKQAIPILGELYLGHLRYATYGKNSIENCHPFLRQNNWMTKNLVLAGNFNLTNVGELFDLLVNLGQHPKEKSDTVTVLEKIGHYLDEQNEELYNKFKGEGYSKKEISPLIAEKLDVQSILQKSSEDWDGGYVMAGMFGHGDAFLFRDPSGIRPAYYYQNDEIIVAASERPALQTVFNLQIEDIRELQPGNALIIKKNGKATEENVSPAKERKACSFEHIYFSRGSDVDIYKERKELGRLVCPQVLKAINNDLKNSVFSFIPNTAEIAFYGMIKGMEGFLDGIRLRKIKELNGFDDEALRKILSMRIRIEKVVIKDVKLRTFISQDDSRDDLVAHVYDITYGSLEKGKDNLIVIDDSIVRGTTLKQSVIHILDRLGPKKIVIVSSAPQIRYPDCYGIDMAKLGDFIAFQAAIQLLKENGKEKIIEDVYQKCKKQIQLHRTKQINCVKEIYAPFSADEISTKITRLLTADDIKSEVEIIYQPIENLKKACPNNLGDWYFTGDYPTKGGNKVANQSFINYFEEKNERSY